MMYVDTPMSHQAGFKLAHLLFHCVAEGRIELPAFKGSFFRGAFGKTLRSTVCLQRKEDCGTCLFKAKCPYSLLFESPSLDGDSSTKWQANYEPHPFVLEPPDDEKESYAPGDTFVLGFTLFGAAVTCLPYFILAVEQMGKAGISRARGRFRLDRVVAENLDGARTIYANETRSLLGSYSLLTLGAINAAFEGVDARSIEITFMTPARLQQNGRLTDRLDFEVFLRALLRRYSWLSSLYCGAIPPLPYRDLLEQARAGVVVNKSNITWCDYERYSFRQQTRLKIGGVKGSVTFEGELAPLLSLIKLGEYLHIGKGTAFGLGKYVMTMYH